jgi:spore coat polysaccharide biosynthesis protein SpsF
MNKQIIVVIQARIGSTRLKNKMLLKLHGYPIIEWVFTRVTHSKLINGLIVSIPDTSENDELAAFIEEKQMNLFRGDEANVLSRVYLAAKKMRATHIVRVCADNPLIDPEAIDDLISFYFKHQPCDYAYNHIPKNNRYPDGLGAEIVAMDILDDIVKNASTDVQTEHMFNYIWDNPKEFNIQTFNPPDDYIAEPNIKLDVDTMEDYNFLNSLPINLSIKSTDLVEIVKKKRLD